MSSEDLQRQIEAQRALMIAVSTGGPRIQTVDEEYRVRGEKIRAGLAEREIEDPNPFEDLWSWHGKWSGALPTWASRRQFISQLYAPLLAQLSAEEAGRDLVREIEPTGWTKVDRGLHQARRVLAEAGTEERFQSVGHLCREILISLGQVVFDPTVHPTVDGVEASETDGKRMLEGYVDSALSGSSNKAARQHVRATVDLANTLQHKRTAIFKDAAVCLEATTSVVNLIAIISGQRDPA
jgi:hypothetical protein